ncbi:MAG TPA: hypothetical protein VLE23_05540 [Geminicoccaceae bacterium]|nr:hypothetical protein [Geminicoccaceae bacterium]
MRRLGLAPRHRRRAALWLAILALAACQGPPESPPPEQPEAARPAPDLGPPAAATRAPIERELCVVLAGVLAAEPDGFARLRAARVANDRWLGRETLPGVGPCTVEGEAWPRARYACASEPFQAHTREGAHARFAALSADIDRCLSKPIWFPREWQKGEPFEFAMGERLQTWTDQSTAPPTQVVLKVQEDIDDHGYQLKLDLEAVR